MTDSPNVKFNITNNNVEQSTPSNGVSHVIARTTKGNPNDPSTLVSSLSQFQRLYGKEIVPDGSISNIETALKGGSKLRISRVLADDAAKYTYKVASTVANDIIVADTVGNNPYHECSIALKVNADSNYLFFKVDSKGFGEAITGIGASNYALSVKLTTSGGVSTLSLLGYNTLKPADMVLPVFTKTIARYTDSTFDTRVFKDFIENNGLVDVTLLAAKIGEELSTDDIPGVNSIADCYLLMDEWEEGSAYSTKTTVTSPMGNEDSYILMGGIGTMGGVPSLENWKAGYDATKDFVDAYQLGVSHINQWLDETNATALHKYIADSVNEIKEVVYYIDVPLYNEAGDAKDDEDIISWVDSLISSVGNSPYIAYFGGGYKYNNPQGFVTDAQNLGTVLALGDTAASTVGPWYHFSGTNRGLVLNSKGIISPNYGSPSNYSKLNALANHRVNMSVVKDTLNYGKQVVLMHNFTSSLKTDSFRFLGVVRLVLYLKKNFRPILESHLEEPNLPVTWRGMHRKIMAVVQDIQARNGLTDPVYVGDQDATSLATLQYNNESDVRMGKYKAKLTFKDVIALQEITFDLEIDSTNKQVTIN